MNRTRHEFEVVRLLEQPSSLFLEYPGLIPFTALGDSVDVEATLRQAAQRVDQIPDPVTKANLMAASGILAGLRLDDEVIYRILRRDIMQESTVYRSIQRETQVENSRSSRSISCLEEWRSILLLFLQAYRSKKFNNSNSSQTLLHTNKPQRSIVNTPHPTRYRNGHHARIQCVSIARDARKEEKREIALNLLQEGVSIETIVRSTGLSIKEVQQLQQQPDTTSH